MRTSCAPRPGTVTRLLLGTAILAGTAGPAVAADGPHLVRVEEDWELVVSEPFSSLMPL